MDENSGNTTDKRNWRERLGIGKNAAPTDLPKLSGDFKSTVKSPEAEATAPKPGTARPAAYTPVKAAPMAPRPAPKSGASSSSPIAERPAGPRNTSMPTENLAAKLRDQREAAEKLAVQRVQAAKQKAESTLVTPASAISAAGKPKFTFADEGAGVTPVVTASPTQMPRPAATPQPTAMPVARPAQVQVPPPQYAPQAQPAFQPQMQPPRPQLGANPGYALPPGHPQQGQGGFAPQPPQYQPQQYQPPQPQQPFPNQGYSQQPAYRPIDPQTGYAPPPGFNPAARPSFQPQAPAANPRGPVPPRAGFQPATQPNPRLGNPPRGPQLKVGPASSNAAESDDVFEPTPARAPRRATANEYQQAYRDEMAFDDETPRSSKLGVILGLVLLGLLTAFGAIYAYSHYAKTQHAATSGTNVPVVAAPQTPTKVVADPAAAGQPVDSGKKLIYDRIEGDHEVLGGQLKSNEEVPQQPQGSGTNIAPSPTVPQPASGNGDGTPLPLPPPPGAATGQQGTLVPDGKTDSATITPAAEPSSAANSSAQAASDGPIAAPPLPNTVTASQTPAPAVALPVPVAAPPPPAPSGNAADTPLAPVNPAKPAAASPKAAAEITDTTPAKPAAKKPDALKKLVLGQRGAKSLGAKPVVLVPPSTSAATAPVVIASNQSTTPTQPIDAGSSLYGDAPVVTAPVVTAPAPRTLSSIFAPAKTIAAAPATPALTKPIATAPAAPAAATGAFVVQLASFASKSDASAEYQRLAAKHGAIITRYAPIIQTAQVAGSTRFRLNLGPMTSNDVASNVCSSLIAAGERDCLVRRQ